MLSKSEVKYIQSLKDRKHRFEERVFVAEGPKLMEELQGSELGVPVMIYATAKIMATIPTHFPAKEISDKELERISFLQSPQSLVMLVGIPDIPFEPIPQNAWSLLLDGIQDPGNLGTIIRIADWFGIRQVYCSADTADLYNPKVVQATMGSVFRTRVYYGGLENWLQQSQPPLYGTMLNGENLWQLGALDPGAIAIGSEGRGLRENIINKISRSVSIPRLGGGESLNAAVATGIVLSHMLQKEHWHQ